MSDPERQDGIGPRVTVVLPDGQQVTVTLHSRRREEDGTWWYAVSIPLWSKTELGRRYSGEPSPVVFEAPAKHCAPIDGEDYTAVPTERTRSRPAYLVERRGPNDGRNLIVHRAGCRAGPGSRIPVHAPQARTHQDDGAQLCEVCGPRL